MNIGTKIKELRISKGLTQSQLAGERITRNMLSCIESEKAMPSLETLFYIADRLSVPPSYLLSDNDDLCLYEKNEKIGQIRKLFSERKHEACIKQISDIGKTDDELAFLLCNCYFELGKAAVIQGSLSTGKSMLALCSEYADKTIYDTSMLRALTELYSSIAENIQSPLLELDSEFFEKTIPNQNDFEFYKYVTQDYSYRFSNETYKTHAKAKELIKNRRYSEAVSELSKIENAKNVENYNSYLFFSVYGDLESCSRQLGDFENAYRYASKRLSLLDGFKS